jgi:ligand-binding sensor domain-containing protein/signal transduction histidine kinase
MDGYLESLPRISKARVALWTCRLWSVLVSSFVASCVPAYALNPDYKLSQYIHTSWRSDAGLQSVRRLKQTPDGYLWLATRGGLVRFDGVRFSTFTAASAEGLESSTIQDLVADPDGSLWVASFDGGIAHYQAGKFRSYTSRDGLPSDNVQSLYRDSRGVLWAGTRHGEISRMLEGRFQKLSLGIPASSISAFLEDADQSLWIATLGSGVFRLQNGTLTGFSVKDGLPDARITGLCRGHSGKIWTVGWNGISSWNGTRFVGDRAVNAAVSEGTTCSEDRDGNLWIASSYGLFRAHAGQLNKMDRSSGLSGDVVSDVFEDKEGDLWVATSTGLDRLEDGAVRLHSPAARDYSGTVGPIVADDKGVVWTVSNKQMARIAANSISVWPMPLPAGSTAFTMLVEPDSGFLVGTDTGLRHWSREHTAPMPATTGLDVRSMLRARDGSIWIGTANRGLLHWRPSSGSRTPFEEGVPDRFITTLAEDRDGAIWAGSSFGGGLYRLAGGHVRHFGQGDDLRSPNIFTIFADGEGNLWIGSSSGLSWFQDGRLRTASSQQGLPSDGVLALVDDSFGRLWFRGYGRITAIEKKSLMEWAAGRRHRLNPTIYRSGDGLQIWGLDGAFPNALRTADGHLWFSIADGSAEVTPPNPGSHPAAFPVLVEDVTIDHVTHSERGGIRIPPGARSIELRYTALTLSDPESVRFRYRLEGYDDNWVDADTRRAVFYDNLKPGAYTFRVAATAGNEQWLESSALALEQVPFFYQTWWFTLLASAAALALALFLYRLRMHQLAREFNVRLEERVGERTRLARDLHDTLLQSFHGLMLHLQAVSRLLPEGKAKEQLEKTMERADRAIAEGRSAVYDLRSSATLTNDLAEAVNAVGNELSNDNDTAFNLMVEGPTKDLHPIIRDEIYRISREALSNAFKHAHARHIEAEISYGPQAFRLRIRDDGEGIPAEVLGQGRAGHFGLPGMRERAKQIGAELTIWSRLRTGTEIDLSLAGTTAYGTSPQRSRFRLFQQKWDEK